MNDNILLKIKQDRLGELCHANGRDVSTFLRAASHSVYDEDVLGKAPGESNPTLDAAKEIVRMKSKVNGTDWWNDPGKKDQLEERRRQHRDGEDSGDAFIQRVGLGRKPDPLIGDREQAVERLIRTLSEVAHDCLDGHNDRCEDADMQLSKHAYQTISNGMTAYIDSRLRQISLVDLESEESLERLTEDVVEQAREMIQEHLEGA